MLKHIAALIAIITAAVAADTVSKECFGRGKSQVGGDGNASVTHATELEKAMTSDMKISQVRGCENAIGQIVALSFQVSSDQNG